MRPLDDFDSLHVQNGEDTEVDRRPHAAEDPVAVEQHEDTAANPACDSAGTAYVHVAGIERHALCEGKRLVKAGDVPFREFLRPDHSHARRRAPGARGRPAGRDRDSGNLEETPAHGNPERILALSLRDDGLLDGAVAVRRHDQRMRARPMQLQRKAAILARERAQRRARHQDFRLREGLARLRVHDQAAEGRTLLGGHRGERGERGERSKCGERGKCGERDKCGEPDQRTASPPSTRHGYCRRQTVVEAESAGCSTTTVRTELSKVYVPVCCGLKSTRGPVRNSCSHVPSSRLV